NLRDRKDPIFIIATNYAERIDRAIKRRGRVDDQYLVLPPDKERRVKILSELLREREPFKTVDSNWLKHELESVADLTVLCVYTELKQLVDDACLPPSIDTAEKIVVKLKGLAQDFRPLISLESYR